jgi:hypothetical protein
MRGSHQGLSPKTFPPPEISVMVLVVSVAETTGPILALLWSLELKMRRMGSEEGKKSDSCLEEGWVIRMVNG